MITEVRTMRPLPVRPIDEIGRGATAPQPVRGATRLMQPLPMPTPDRDLTHALRETAYQRMIERLNVQPLPVFDPTA